jgi:hypothetical protein
MAGHWCNFPFHERAVEELTGAGANRIDLT